MYFFSRFVPVFPVKNDREREREFPSPQNKNGNVNSRSRGQKTPGNTGKRETGTGNGNKINGKRPGKREKREIVKNHAFSPNFAKTF